ncbi:MAG: hypothetical protein CVT72_00280, partial [Alphaproteobacteria bacterium HGW-Alphaproteobacteria-11]
MDEATHDMESELQRAGAMPESELDLARLALTLAALDRPELEPDPYLAHLDELVGAAGDALPGGAGGAPAGIVAGALAGVVAGRFRYLG